MILWLTGQPGSGKTTLCKEFSEKVIYMPNCYQVNISNRYVSNIPRSKSELGLPENAFIFCCFNNTYKITQKVFYSWMDLSNENINYKI